MSSANGTPIMEVPKARIKSDSYQMPDILRQEGQRATGVDEAQLGISPESGRTATENQRVQRNANLRMVLSSKVDSWAEKRKARIWDRLYCQYFKPTEEKNIFLNNGFSQVPYKVKGEDFDTQKNIDITVKHKADIESDRETKKGAYMVWANMLLQTASSEHQKNHTMREFGKSLGLDKEVVASHVPDTADEMQAKLDLELINRNQDP